jgi:mevalonate kinase
MTKKALKEIKHKLSESYDAFKRGETGIKDVLKLPFELSQFALGHFLEKINHEANDGFKLTTESDIPIGCGMGSSAAMILAVMHAIALSQGKQFDKEYYYQHALDAENLQHGNASGLDVRTSLQGGCIQFQEGEFSSMAALEFPLQIVNTGKPQSSTGECVSSAKKHFEGTALASEFAAITDKISQAIKSNDKALLQESIKVNHRLLTLIGVVPDKIQRFIAELEQQGFAAKVCGAGSINGDSAGMVMIVGDNCARAICQQYAYKLQSVEGDSLGLRHD